jgi:ketosteroid isomerase-like protein
MSQENVEIVSNALHAFSEGDLAAVLELWGDEAEWRPAVLGGGLLEGAVYRGRDGVREFFQVQSETWDTITARPVATRDLGDLVLVEVELEAVGRASGASVNQRTWNVFKVQDGLIRAGRVFTDEAQARRAAGLQK